MVINKIFKMMICTVCIFMSMPHIPGSDHMYASNYSPVELHVQETEDLHVGDVLYVSMNKIEQVETSSVMILSENTTLALDDIDTHIQDVIDYNEGEKQIEVDWETVAVDTVVLPILVTGSGAIELVAQTDEGDDSEVSNRIALTVPADKAESNNEQSEDKEDKKEQEEKEEEDSVQPELSENEQDEKQDSRDEQGEQEKSSKGASEEEDTEQSTKAGDDKPEKEANADPSEQEKAQKQTEATKPLADSNGVVEVSSWSGLLDAMEEAEVKEIQITSGFSTSGLTKEYPVNGDKIIEGNGHAINFHRHRFNIESYKVKVNDLTIQANQYNAGNPKASVFYSDTDGTLILKNTSFDGIQHGQAAKMKHGHVKVAGKVNIQTTGPYEVFEAKDITFMEGAEFLGETTQTNEYRKETLNVYNDATITVEPNASVVLKGRSRNSIIKGQENSSATIDIGENAMFQVYADHIVTSAGKDLITLPGANSSITVGKDATFDIENHREGRQIASLINMHGTLKTDEEGGKLAYWEKGSNSDEPSGPGYTEFPRVLKGKLEFSADIIDSAQADRFTALGKSEDTEKNGKTFQDLLTGKDTSNVKRLYITHADKPQTPNMDTFTEKDNILAGTADPGIDIEIRDEFGNKWETTADEETGSFTLNLGDSAPYEAGEELFVKAIDPYGVKSDEATVPVIGITLKFEVPDTLNFQQEIKKDEEMTIGRRDSDWSIDVTNTRGSGSEWGITAKVEEPFENENNHQLPEDALVFVKDGESKSLKDSVQIEKDDTGEKRQTVIDWNEGEGILLQLNPIQSGVEPHTEYSTTIKWTLTDAP